MPIRVVHCGTGLTGSEALRAIIADPALELVGHYVSTRMRTRPTRPRCTATSACR